MRVQCLLNIISFIFIGFLSVSSPQAVETKPILTLEMASKIADTCESVQQGKDFNPIVIAIYDDGGNLKLFRRQDNSFLGSITIAHMKATTSSSFPFSSRLLGELVYGKDGQPGRILGGAEVAGHAAFPGGLPIITKNGTHIGSVGVSGATSDEDEQCAQAGLDSIADLL
jgi:glc operon protein GlcG